jgi:hypothetical protein
VNIEILNWLGPPWEAEKGGMKKTGRGESVRAVILICMEPSQGNSLCSYLYLNLAKHHVTHFNYYVFSPTILESIREEQVLPGRGGQLALV